jgi:uncharacterized protein
VPNFRNIRVNFGTVKLVLLCLAYLAAIASAEFITYYINPIGGVIFYFVILFSLITNSVMTRDEYLRGWWLALGLVPLVRIIGLGVPVAEISEIYLYIIIAAPIFIGAIVIILNLKYSLDDDAGLNGKKPLVQVLVAILGAGLGFADYVILKPESWINELNIQTIVIPALILLIATGFVEEFVFRGVIQRAARPLGSWGWVYVSVIYALLQIGQGSVAQLVFVFIVAVFFGWVVKKTGSIIGVSLSHGLLNIALYLVVPHLGLNLTIPGLF